MAMGMASKTKNAKNEALYEKKAKQKKPIKTHGRQLGDNIKR